MGDPGDPVGWSQCGATFLTDQPHSSPQAASGSASCLPFCSPTQRSGQSWCQSEMGQGTLVTGTLGPPSAWAGLPGATGQFPAQACGGGVLRAQMEVTGEQEPHVALVPCHVSKGGLASPLSTCSGDHHHPRSDATGTPWWPLTATSMCSGVRQTTHCPMSCTAMMWTSRPGRLSSPVQTAR